MEYIFIYISFLLSFLAPSKMMIASVSLFGTTVHDGRKTEGGPTSNKYCQNGKSCRKWWQRGIQKSFPKSSQFIRKVKHSKPHREIRSQWWNQRRIFCKSSKNSNTIRLNLRISCLQTKPSWTSSWCKAAAWKSGERRTNGGNRWRSFQWWKLDQHWWWHTPAGCTWSQNRPAFVPCLGSSYSRLPSLSSEIDKKPSALNRGPLQVGWFPVGQQIQLEVISFFFFFVFCNPGF